MARGIVSCTGERFDIGDVVRTAEGTLLRVQGAAIGVKFHNAETCTKVGVAQDVTDADIAKHNTVIWGSAPITSQSTLPGGTLSTAPAQKPITDCIVWGS